MFQGEPVPLKVGIHLDLFATIPADAGFSAKHLRIAVDRWVRSPPYQAALKVEADRWDLYRNKAGVVEVSAKDK